MSEPASTTAAAVSRLHVPSSEELTDRTRRLFEATERTGGFVPNWLRAFALGGADNDRLNAYLFPLLEGSDGRRSTLTTREREIIATVVSVENRCPYCHTLHIDGLARHLGDHHLATRIGLDHREVDELTEREHALAELATTITRAPREVTREHLDHLRDLGLDDAGIYEAIQIASVINATNRISIALAVLPDPETFDAQNTALNS